MRIVLFADLGCRCSPLAGRFHLSSSPKTTGMVAQCSWCHHYVTHVFISFRFTIEVSNGCCCFSSCGVCVRCHLPFQLRLLRCFLFQLLKVVGWSFVLFLHWYGRPKPFPIRSSHGKGSFLSWLVSISIRTIFGTFIFPNISGHYSHDLRMYHML